jgi:PTS hybrid protein
MVLVGIVLVSHSRELAQGLAALAGEVAGDEVRIEPAGGGPEGGLGTNADLVSAAIKRADAGAGVLILGDLGSSLLTVKHLIDTEGNGHVKLADAPFVEGAIAAAVVAAAGIALDGVLEAAEQTRGAKKF